MRHPKIAHSIHKNDLLRKHQEQQDAMQQLQDTAFREATRFAAILVEEFGVRKVVLVGPLTYGQFQPGMAIELAVEGISVEAYAPALAYLKQISPFRVDLITIEYADSWTQRSIAKTGKVLAQK
ncbi:hypothetical protein GF339_15320 [candidate division KSB3 bacterium]|uniref:Uncharacterized protein n=1 Tax=candidate division KSB3 bacterium TaxID=2044937 RepID=A0A9D5JXV1_9BACT|nr:hypothetical protein [candidate division KSB3 bacterium]MBD3325956.1 hypothetical protein [candidate division KSB3 bacterium]